MRTRNLTLTFLTALLLAACGGGISTDGETITFSAYVYVPPVYYGPPPSNGPIVAGFPSYCIVWEGGSSYTLYGYGYRGCPQLIGRDLVGQFMDAYPSVWVDSWYYPTTGTARITIR